MTPTMSKLRILDNSPTFIRRITKKLGVNIDLPQSLKLNRLSSLRMGASLKFWGFYEILEPVIGSSLNGSNIVWRNDTQWKHEKPLDLITQIPNQKPRVTTNDAAWRRATKGRHDDHGIVNRSHYQPHHDWDELLAVRLLKFNTISDLIRLNCNSGIEGVTYFTIWLAISYLTV